MKLLEQRRQGALFFSYTCTLNVGDEWNNAGLKKFVPKGYGLNKLACSQDEIRWFFDEENLVEAGTVLCEQLWNHPQEANLLFELFEKVCWIQENFCSQIAKKRLNDIATQELVRISNDFFKIYSELFDIGCAAELLDFSFNKTIPKELNRQQIPAKNHSEIISVLSMPKEESFSRSAEKEILFIAKAIQEKKLNANKAFQNQQIKEMIENHIEKYYWISCNYFSFSGLGARNVTKLVAEALQREKDPSTTLNKYDSEAAEWIEKEKQLLFQFNLDEKTRFLLELAKRVAWMYDKRKKAQMHGFYAIGRILKEICRRVDIDFDLAKYVIPTEIEDFAKGKIPAQVLFYRREHSFIDYNTHPPAILTGKPAQLAEEGLWKTSELSKKEVNGVCASPGVAIGTCRVIKSKKQLHELRAGEILVTSMTDPEFVPFLKKVAGIITDDGGITSHSAIIARELGVPCIVGTKVATKVIQTGDRVELRAHHGLCRMIA